jgi:hypothetical protein
MTIGKIKVLAGMARLTGNVLRGAGGYRARWKGG